MDSNACENDEALMPVVAVAEVAVVVVVLFVVVVRSDVDVVTAPPAVASREAAAVDGEGFRLAYGLDTGLLILLYRVVRDTDNGYCMDRLDCTNK